LCAMLESYSSLYLGAPAPWSFEGSSACRRSSGLVWSGVDSFVQGTWRPHPSWRSSLVENGIKLTRNLRVPWWPSLRGKLRCPRKRLSGREAILLLSASTIWTRGGLGLPISWDKSLYKAFASLHLVLYVFTFFLLAICMPLLS